jgi:hypothetical protein
MFHGRHCDAMSFELHDVGQLRAKSRAQFRERPGGYSYGPFTWPPGVQKARQDALRSKRNAHEPLAPRPHARLRCVG